MRRRHNAKAHVLARKTVGAGEALKQGLPTRFRGKDDSTFAIVPDATFTVTLQNTKREYLETLEAKKPLAVSCTSPRTRKQHNVTKGDDTSKDLLLRSQYAVVNAMRIPSQG